MLLVHFGKLLFIWESSGNDVIINHGYVAVLIVYFQRPRMDVGYRYVHVCEQGDLEVVPPMSTKG